MNTETFVGLTGLDYAVLLGYLAVVLAIGLYFSRGTKNTEDYLLGGRRIPWWAVGISYSVSVTSTLSFVAIPGEAYKSGVTMALGLLLVPITAVVTFFIFVPFFFKVLVFTPFSYLERRFDGPVRTLAAAMFCFTRLLYIALVLYSSSKVFEGTAGWNLAATILLIGAIGILYTVLGGIRAVVWTDVAQFVMMMGGMLLLTIWIVDGVPGGISGIFGYATSNDHFIRSQDADFVSFSPYVRLTIWLIIAGAFTESLFFHSSDQITLQRMLSTSGYDQAKRALYARLVVDIPMMLWLWFIGLGIWVFYQHQPEAARPVAPDHALFQFIASELPRPVPGLIVAALMAAVMSTLDSGINSLATVFTKDFYVRFCQTEVTEATQLRFSRWMTVVTGLVAMAVALIISSISEAAESTVLESSWLWMSLNYVIPAAFLLAVFSRRATGRHVLIALGTGAAWTVVLIGIYLNAQYHGQETVSPFYIGASAMVVTIVVGLVASRFARRRSDEELKDLTLWTLSKGDE